MGEMYSSLAVVIAAKRVYPVDIKHNRKIMSCYTVHTQIIPHCHCQTPKFFDRPNPRV